MVKATFYFKEKDGSIKKETKKVGLRLIPTLNKWIKQGRELVDIECKDKNIESYMKNEIIKHKKNPEIYEPTNPLDTAIAITGANITKVRAKIQQQTNKYLDKIKKKDQSSPTRSET